MDDFTDDPQPEPADVLAQSSRMPRSLCAFVLRLNGWDMPASEQTLSRISSEIPGWSNLPQGVLYKQVQALVGHARSGEVSISVDIDLDDFASAPEGEEPRTNDARVRGVRDANAVIAQGKLELRSPKPLPLIPCGCPACLTLDRFPKEAAPTHCTTCGGPLLRTFSAGEEAGIDPSAYCEFFNARALEHIRQTIDEGFELSQLRDAQDATSVVVRAAPPAGLADDEEPTEAARPPSRSSDATQQAVPRAALESLFADPISEEAPAESPDAPEPDNELERAVLVAEDWRIPISAVPFELDALLAVRKRAALDAARELQAGAARRFGPGAGDDGLQRFDCPACVQTWAAAEALAVCPACGGGLLRHARLEGEDDEAALAYRAAYDEAVLEAVRQFQPHFAWHLLFEAPGSIQARLAAETGVAPEIAALAWDVSAGDEAATRELLGWLGQRLGPAGSVEEAQAALAEIGAEADAHEVEGRRNAEELLRRGALVRHAGEPSHVCPACMKRWPTAGEPPAACAQCGGPLIVEQPLGDEADPAQRATLQSLNARIDRHVRSVLAPGFDIAQVEPA